MTNDNMPYAYMTRIHREIMNALKEEVVNALDRQGAYKTQTPVAIKTTQGSAPTYARMQKGA